MAEPDVKAWLCVRDDKDTGAPYCATLLIDNRPIASGRGIDELSAFAQLGRRARPAGRGRGTRVLGMHGLMRQWRNSCRNPV